MIRRFALIATLFLTLPGTANALSCARPDVARSFHIANKASETYLIVLGEIEYLGKSLRKSTRPETRKARLRARAITRTGFSAWLDRDITVNITCAGPWCGSIPQGERLLIFLRQSAAGDVIDAQPCAQFVFTDPGQAEMRTLRSCLSGGHCEPRYR